MKRFQLLLALTAAALLSLLTFAWAAMSFAVFWIGLATVPDDIPVARSRYGQAALWLFSNTPPWLPLAISLMLAAALCFYIYKRASERGSSDGHERALSKIRGDVDYYRGKVEELERALVALVENQTAKAQEDIDRIEARIVLQERLDEGREYVAKLDAGWQLLDRRHIQDWSDCSLLFLTRPPKPRLISDQFASAVKGRFAQEGIVWESLCRTPEDLDKRVALTNETYAQLLRATVSAIEADLKEPYRTRKWRSDPQLGYADR